MEHDPALAALHDELDRLGFVVVPHGQHLCVRLPLLASVVVKSAGDRLQLQPQFGPLKRSRALTLGAVGLPAGVAAAFAALGAEPASLAAAAGAVAYLFTDLYRLILTENCVARLQALWAGGIGAPRQAGALASGPAGRQLPAQSPNDAPRPKNALSAATSPRAHD